MIHNERLLSSKFQSNKATSLLPFTSALSVRRHFPMHAGFTQIPEKSSLVFLCLCVSPLYISSLILRIYPCNRMNELNENLLQGTTQVSSIFQCGIAFNIRLFVEASGCQLIANYSGYFFQIEQIPGDLPRREYLYFPDCTAGIQWTIIRLPTPKMATATIIVNKELF